MFYVIIADSSINSFAELYPELWGSRELAIASAYRFAERNGIKIIREDNFPSVFSGDDFDGEYFLWCQAPNGNEGSIDIYPVSLSK